jgi:MinD-like ATPase involved in chromosome partitioning or flagellar assembly
VQAHVVGADPSDDVKLLAVRRQQGLICRRHPMSKTVSVHSFRGGTGKSNTTANLAALIAAEGCRVGVVDTDIASPGIHVLFGLKEEDMAHSLNDYLWNKCEIQETAHDVTANLGSDVRGRVFLVPSSVKAGEIARVLREGYDVGLLNDGFRDLIEALDLDILMIDTHPGLNEETLLSIAISDVLLIILRPDQQDYQGTGVTVEVARRLGVPQMMLIVNKVPAVFSEKEVRTRVEDAYQAKVAGVLPHSEEMMALASAGVFVTRYPDHPITKTLLHIARQLTS